MTHHAHRALRRLAGAATASVLLVATIAACGTDTGPENGSGSGSDPAGQESSDYTLPEAEGTTEYPLTIDTWLGETTLEERPERIAVIGYSSNLDALEAVGVAPVYYGGRDAEADYTWNDPEFLDAIETVDQYDDFVPKPEAIAATQPDLIVALGILTEEAEFERLSNVAPVLELPENPGVGDKIDWRDVQAQVGEALDLSAAAEQAVTDADERIAAVAEAHPEFEGKTSTIVYDYGPEWGGIEYYTVADGFAEGLMLDLGFEPNPRAEDFVDDPAVADENVGLIDGDALVVIYNSDAEREARESQGLFAALPAVRDGHYESLVYPESGAPNDPLTTSGGDDAQNAVWPLRRGASAVSLPWAAEVVAEEWLVGTDLR